MRCVMVRVYFVNGLLTFVINLAGVKHASFARRVEFHFVDCEQTRVFKAGFLA